MSAKPRTTPKDLVLSVRLARRPGAKARGLPRIVPAVRIPLCFSAISRTCWRRGGIRTYGTLAIRDPPFDHSGTPRAAHRLYSQAIYRPSLNEVSRARSLSQQWCDRNPPSSAAPAKRPPGP